MPSESVAQTSSGLPADRSVEGALALLIEALEIVDALNLLPNVGARLQEAIDALEGSPGA